MNQAPGQMPRRFGFLGLMAAYRLRRTQLTTQLTSRTTPATPANTQPIHHNGEVNCNSTVWLPPSNSTPWNR